MSTVEFGFLTLGTCVVLTAIVVSPAGSKLSALGWWTQMLALTALLGLFFCFMGWTA